MAAKAHEGICVTRVNLHSLCRHKHAKAYRKGKQVCMNKFSLQNQLTKANVFCQIVRKQPLRESMSWVNSSKTFLDLPSSF